MSQGNVAGDRSSRATRNPQPIYGGSSRSRSSRPKKLTAIRENSILEYLTEIALKDLKKYGGTENGRQLWRQELLERLNDSNGKRGVITSVDLDSWLSTENLAGLVRQLESEDENSDSDSGRSQGKKKVGAKSDAPVLKVEAKSDAPVRKGGAKSDAPVLTAEASTPLSRPRPSVSRYRIRSKRSTSAAQPEPEVKKRRSERTPAGKAADSSSGSRPTVGTASHQQVAASGGSKPEPKPAVPGPSGLPFAVGSWKPKTLTDNRKNCVVGFMQNVANTAALLNSSWMDKVLAKVNQLPASKRKGGAIRMRDLEHWLSNDATLKDLADTIKNQIGSAKDGGSSSQETVSGDATKALGAVDGEASGPPRNLPDTVPNEVGTEAGASAQQNADTAVAGPSQVSLEKNKEEIQRRSSLNREAYAKSTVQNALRQMEELADKLKSLAAEVIGSGFQNYRMNRCRNLADQLSDNMQLVLDPASEPDFFSN